MVCISPCWSLANTWISLVHERWSWDTCELTHCKIITGLSVVILDQFQSYGFSAQKIMPATIKATFHAWVMYYITRCCKIHVVSKLPNLAIMCRKFRTYKFFSPMYHPILWNSNAMQRRGLLSCSHVTRRDFSGCGSGDGNNTLSTVDWWDVSKALLNIWLSAIFT